MKLRSRWTTQRLHRLLRSSLVGGCLVLVDHAPIPALPRASFTLALAEYSLSSNRTTHILSPCGLRGAGGQLWVSALSHIPHMSQQMDYLTNAWIRSLFPGRQWCELSGIGSGSGPAEYVIPVRAALPAHLAVHVCLRPAQRLDCSTAFVAMVTRHSRGRSNT